MRYTKKAISALMLGSIVTVGAFQLNVNPVGATEENTAIVGVGAITEDFLASVPVEADQAENEVDATNAAAETVLFPDFEGKCMADVEASLNVRMEPSTDSQIVGKMFPEAVATVVETKDGWTKITSGNVEGYISNDYVLAGDEAGKRADEICLKSITVETQTLNVRAEQSTDSAILVQIPQGEKYKVVAVHDEWIEIQLSDETGFVSKEYVDVVLNTTTAKSLEEIQQEEEEAKRAEEEAERQAAAAAQNNNSQASSTTTTTQNSSTATTTTTTTTSQPAPSATSGTRAEVVNYALQFVGNPYVYGGTSLTNGTDCSGFTMSVYAHFGYSLYRTSRDQIYNGTNIPVDQVKPGDLLFYSNNGRTIGHVAMYIGDGKIVHASTSKTGIIVSNMYYRTPCGATRIIND
ncbi:MAG: C40 family peptidase [Lachnospiraceae bacterium]|nr:C40 family peptidase [Lachnospiraceae bacterium]